MIDYNSSVVLVGGLGAGKSLIARTLSKKHNVDYITVDEFRHLPSLKEIKQVLGNPNTPPRKHDEFLHYKHLREKYPTIKNYDDFGFKMNVAEYLRHNFGIVAWHYYVKAFENMLIEDICQKVNGTIILDTGAGFAVSLDDHYERLKQKFESLDKKLFYKEFNHLEYVGKDVTYNLFKPFKHVYYITIPEDKMLRSEKAQEDSFNKYTLHSGDYERVSTSTIDATGLFSTNPYNDSALHGVVESIEHNYFNNLNDNTL